MTAFQIVYALICIMNRVMTFITTICDYNISITTNNIVDQYGTIYFGICLKYLNLTKSTNMYVYIAIDEFLDCSVLAIDEFLLQCSSEFPAAQQQIM
eukprot:134753_1